MGGGYKPLALAVSGVLALGLSGVASAVDVDWDAAKADADIVVNEAGTSQANESIHQWGDSAEHAWGSDKDLHTAYVVGAPSGAGSSFGLFISGDGTATLTQDGQIYVDASSGYAAGLAVGIGHEGKVVNDGAIYVRGSAFNPSRGKGISIDDGYGVNNGEIYVEDAYGMVSNTQGTGARNRIENSGTISGSGLASAGMVVNKGGNQIQVRNDGTIDLSEGGEFSSGILVSGDVDAAAGTVYVTNAGTVIGSKAGDAVTVNAAKTNVQLTFTGNSLVTGDIHIAGQTNNTTMVVETDQRLSLDAEYLKGLTVNDSTLTLDNTGDLTIANASLSDGNLIFGEVAGVIQIDNVTKEGDSSIDFGGNDVAMTGNWTINYGEKHKVGDFTFDSDPSTHFTLTNNGTLRATGEIYIGNETFVNNGWDLAAVEPSNGAVYAKSLTLSGDASFTNTGLVDVAGKVTIEASGDDFSFSNSDGGTQYPTRGCFQMGSLESNADLLTNDGVFEVRNEATINGDFRNDANGNATFTGKLTLGNAGATVANNGGALTIGDVDGGQVTNMRNGTLTFADGSVINAIVQNRSDGALRLQSATVSGRLENASQVNATGTATVTGTWINQDQGLEDGETLVVKGSYTNSGRATWHSVSATSGEWVNAQNGNFKADTADFTAEHSWTMLITRNEGTATFGSLTIGDETFFTNTGTLTVNNTLEILDDSFQNHGTFNLNGFGNIDAAYLENTGTMTFGENAVVSAGDIKNTGTFMNNGFVSGVSLTVTGDDSSYTNEGTSAWTDLTVGTDALNNGSEQVNNAKIDGVYTNNGSFSQVAANGEGSFALNGTFRNNAGATVRIESGAQLGIGAQLMNDAGTLTILGNADFGISASLRNLTDSKATIGSVSGSGIITNGGRMTIGSVGSVNTAASISNDRGGQLHLIGDFTLDTLNAGESSTLFTDGTFNIDTLSLKSGSSLENRGNITATSDADFSGVKYKQVGGDSSLDINVWFNDSTIELSEGASFDRIGKTLGTGNKYILSSSLAGDLNSIDFKGNWRDGFSTLRADVVDGANNFELNQGGLLIAQDFGSFTGEGFNGKITFNGGALETSLEDFFTSVTYVDAGSGAVIDNPDLIGDEIAGNTVGDINGELQNGIVVGDNGGHLVFNDNLVSFILVGEVGDKLNEQWGDGMTAHYTGDLEGVTDLTIDGANTLLDGQKSGLIFHNVALSATEGNPHHDGMFSLDAEGDLVMDGDRTVNYNDTKDFGVRNVTDTDHVTIKKGANFTLVGGYADEWLVSDGETGGSVTINGSDSSLTLGYGAGKLVNVTLEDGGHFDVVSGSYTIEGSVHGEGAITNAGYLHVTENVDVDQLQNESGLFWVEGNAEIGDVYNSAGLVVDGSLSSDVAFVNSVNGVLSVSGDLNAFAFDNLADDSSVGRVAVAGNVNIDTDFTNQAGGQINVGGDLAVGGADGIQNQGLISVEGKVDADYGITNGGKAQFQAGSIASAGKVDNDGILVVTDELSAQNLENAGQISAGSISVAENFSNEKIVRTTDLTAGSLENLGQGWILVEGKADIGEFTNSGTSQFNEAVIDDFTNVADAVAVVNGMAEIGTLTNSGSVQFGEADIETLTNAANAVMIVAGKAQIGTLNNNGTAQFEDSLVLSGTSDNHNAMVVAGDLTANDVLFNHANAELSVGGNAALTGVFANQGQAVFGGDVSVNQAVNAGDEAVMAVAGNLSVEESFDNQSTLTVYGGLNVNGSFASSGKTFVDGTTTIDGTFTQTDGQFVALGGEGGNVINGSASVSGGNFVLGDTTMNAGSVLTVTNGATAQVSAANDKMSGRINVDGATFTLGDILPDTLSNVDEPQHEASSIFKMNEHAVDLGSEGVIAVGNGAANVELAGGSVWFGSDSLLELNTSTYDGNQGFFKGQGSFKVEDGAQIQVSDASIGWGTYTLVSEGFSDVELAEGGWLEHENIIYTGDRDVDLTIRENEDGNVEITVGSNNILDKLPDVAIPNIVNEVIADPHRSPNESGVKGFLAGAIENGILDESLQAETINDTAQIMAAGGVMVQGMTLVGNVLDITDRHLSYEDVHFKNGQLQHFDGVRLWADALGQRVDASGYDFSGSSAEFDGYNTGFILGADLMASCDARYGAAFAYQNANIDSNGSAVKTSNEADAYTFALYAAKTFGNFNFIGSLAYTRIDSDLEQSLPGVLGAKQGKHTMDVQNDIYTLGLKGEYNIALSKSVQAVPYVSVRAVWMDTSDEKSKMAHQGAFDYDTDSVTQVQFPIGVAFQGTTETKSGWTGRGVIDFSVTPVAGDKDVDTTITANGLTAEDVVNTEFADDLTGAVRIGISAEKDNMAFGGNLGFSTGGSRDGNVTFGLNARYRF